MQMIYLFTYIQMYNFPHTFVDAFINSLALFLRYAVIVEITLWMNICSLFSTYNMWNIQLKRVKVKSLSIFWILGTFDAIQLIQMTLNSFCWMTVILFLQNIFRCNNFYWVEEYLRKNSLMHSQMWLENFSQSFTWFVSSKTLIKFLTENINSKKTRKSRTDINWTGSSM